MGDITATHTFVAQHKYFLIEKIFCIMENIFHQIEKRTDEQTNNVKSMSSIETLNGEVIIILAVKG